MGALDGVRVLDLSRNLPGPLCSWLLAGLGAEVDRVETPGVGDPTRHVPPFVEGAGAFFSAVSRGKRSVGVSLRHPEGPAVIRRIVGRYDVLVDGFRPGVLEAIGLGPEALHATHPGLVIARLSGYGQTGPWRARPGHDLNYLGLVGGLAGAQETDRGLAFPTLQVADCTGGMVAAFGVAAALFARERSGRGDVVDVSLAEAALTLLAPHALVATVSGKEPEPSGEFLNGGVPIYGTYVCSDGRWITLGALEPKFQQAVRDTVGSVSRPDLAAAFATRTRDEWCEVLGDACVAPVNAFAELADHPQLAARGAARRLGDATWVSPPLGEPSGGPVPKLGEHTDAILAEAGVDSVQIAGWRDAGAVG